MAQKRIFLAGTCRTPVGAAPRGNLKDVPAEIMLSMCFRKTLERAGVKPEAIDEVIAGNIAQSSEAPNITRVAALMAQIPEAVPAFTVQRNCGSGLQAVVSAAQMIKLDEANVVLAGGTENMSRIPFVLKNMRNGTRYFPGQPMKNFVDALDEGLTDPITRELMGVTAEKVAEKHGVSRADQDEFAAESHKKAFRAIRSGKFRSQIVALNNSKETISEDEGIDPTRTKQVMALAPTIFKPDGTVTPYNSCPLSDGASSLLVMDEKAVARYGVKPEAEVLSYAFAGLNPSYMGMGPALAIPKAINRILDFKRYAEDTVIKDVIDIFEINEAFAAQVLACQRQLGVYLEKLNPWGGAIALGHPVGATGAILICKILAILKDLKKEYGVISMCIGGGQGGALVLRNMQ
ncbi:MAG: hypothetical protein A3E64_00860 [Candidatus Harrisonbacteria bacterium RIFCSPHIGHO2_12_FULL_48_16]|uniref:Acetyl-CoA acetyltransferase n=1 Tax=Candidatus Harrisonbacteria bacterium RIFCSPHIGHO2_12_FULL_48_16 TaxID=1798405 RepID=A0A1G1ZHJ8_9BACT|nr:MAG: hypothetical protein A3E64_00860 [Candidatus Harrisonbacteria bacterium RIFCSPHIGHO2_12_FULL_48_16]